MPCFSQSRFAAKLQDIISKRREDVGLYKEIAEKLPLNDTRRFLDVGTGSGLQLKVIHEIKPDLELFGIDISAAAIRVAQKNLKGIDVDLRVESIENTSFDDDYFDIVTCNTSMTYWENPSSCFNEIFRILRPGGSAILFEPQEKIDIDEAIEIIKANLADKSPLRRFMAASFNRFAFRWGRFLGLRLYSIDELNVIANRSKFANQYSIETIILQNLPFFVKITLNKPN